MPAQMYLRKRCARVDVGWRRANDGAVMGGDASP